ncbi:conserved hypothetical protein [uncultured Eubacteriales bacterium]|uniref:Antitoxin SocA-like Panacea domain-containing protein n=1 Tax=uncultured Eubacteriales bacterium TaxID=172733 RepID=A0A212J4W2_9FIRM|nr:conserved hypothetical protein [uncultured Eubacteriales bacterium]
MYSALSVAQYVVDYCNKYGKGISNLKLQKILYFVQAEFLVSQHKPCFRDEIEAWDFGPVVPTVYHKYKRYGGAIIPSNSIGALYSSIDPISSKDRSIIESIVNQGIKYSASELVDITHNQKPWRLSYRQGRNNVIPISLIRDYFEG